ncbi:general substrate transporter [Penicillium riverlandense]|uniref:general substrate transporter n=1 Tax=Penicillium riverlandense TaxID=1903569 RepID=UPI00254854CD|nr:general substrate transporter [Penicillium riverlandense]KAJ5808669.1 general substrate transporter [Penicillium riverlandense]
MFIYARVITSVGTGHLNAIVLVWSAKVAQTHSRGLSSYATPPLQPLTCLPAIILACVIWFLPESPRWLIKTGRNEEALEVLQALRGANSASTEEYNEIIDVVEAERSLAEKGIFISLFFGTASGKLHLPLRANLAFWLQVMMEWNGITAIIVFSPTIYAQAGYGTTKAGWLSALTNTTSILGTLIASQTIDKFGRRNLLFVGAASIAVTMLLAGEFDKLLVDRPSQASEYGAISVLWIFLYTLIYSSTWLIWAIGYGSSILANPVMFSQIQEKIFYIYGALNIAWIPLVYLF